jgi:23S rRNA (adenine1618-N6)-methyltransferase
MCTPGGEVGFLTHLIEESLVIRERVRWYSSMLGKLSSVSTLVQKLKEHEVASKLIFEIM